MMDSKKRKEWIKLLGAFTLGAALIVAITGANGTLWQGKVMKGSSSDIPVMEFTLDEEIIDTDCDATHCDIENEIIDLHDQLGYSTWTTEALARQVDFYAQWIIPSIVGRTSSGGWSSWTLEALAEYEVIITSYNRDYALEQIKGTTSSGGTSSWTLQALAGQIEDICR